jgi:hypothetical protein
LACVIAMPLALLAGPAAADWLFDVDAGATYDSNVTRAAKRDDVRDDTAARASVAATSFQAFTAYDAVTLAAEFGGERFVRFRGLDNAWSGVRAGYRHKAGLGYAAPWLALDASLAYHDYESDVRTGPRFVLRATAGKRFDEAFDAYVELFVDRRYGPHGEAEVPGISGRVFDLRGRGGAAGLHYAVDETLAISARGSVRRGDVVSTASAPSPLFAASRAIAEDSAFGDELYDYRLGGTTWSLALAASLALDEHASLSAGYVAERTRVAYGFDYRSQVATMTFLYRFSP